MNLFALSGLSVGIVSLAMGLFVLSKGPAKRLNRVWCAFTLSVAVWGFGVLWIAMESDPYRALLAWRTAYAFGVIWIPVSFYHFVLIFCEKARGRLLPLHYLMAGIFSLLALFTPLIHADVRYVFSSFYYGQPGFLFPVYFTWWVGLVFYDHYHVLQRYWKVSGIRRQQCKYILIAFISAFGTGSLAYLPQFGIDVYPAYGTFGIMFYPIIVTYAIVAYRALDIATVLHKTALWLTLSSLIVFPATGLYLLGEKGLEGASPVARAAAVGVMTLLLIPYVRIVQSRLDHLFQRRQYDMQKILRQLLRDTAMLGQPACSIQKMIQTVQENLYVSKVTLMLWNKAENRFAIMPEQAADSETAIQASPSVCSWLVAQERVIMWDEHPDGKDPLRPIIQSYLAQCEARVILPFAHQGTLIGWMLLGEKKNLEPYSETDLEFLSTLRAEIVIALSNSLLYDDLKKLSEQLRQAGHILEENVAALHRSNEALQQFAHVAAHDLSEPLRSVGNYVGLLARRYKGQLDKEADEFIDYALGGVKRAHVLIDDLLKYAQASTGDMVMSPVESSVAFNTALLNLKAAIEASSATVTADSLPQVMADSTQLVQLFQNLISNAIKFKGDKALNVHLSAQRISASASASPPWCFSVRDNGIGIAPQFFERIFEIFRRLHTQAKYPGTGIGLAVCRTIVERSGGQIWVESEVGTGTTFYFTLPAVEAPTAETM